MPINPVKVQHQKHNPWRTKFMKFDSDNEEEGNENDHDEDNVEEGEEVLDSEKSKTSSHIVNPTGTSKDDNTIENDNEYKPRVCGQGKYYFIRQKRYFNIPTTRLWHCHNGID